MTPEEGREAVRLLRALIEAADHRGRARVVPTPTGRLRVGDGDDGASGSFRTWTAIADAGWLVIRDDGHWLFRDGDYAGADYVVLHELARRGGTR